MRKIKAQWFWAVAVISAKVTVLGIKISAKVAVLGIKISAVAMRRFVENLPGGSIVDIKKAKTRNEANAHALKTRDRFRDMIKNDKNETIN